MKKRIIEYILRRFTDYHALKEDNHKLKSDLRKIVIDKDSEVTGKWYFYFRMDDEIFSVLFAGSGKNTETKGIFNHAE